MKPTETYIKTALSGVNRKGSVSAVSCLAHPDRRKQTPDRVLVEGVIDLPETPWMLTKAELSVLYIAHELNTWQIAQLARVSHSTIVEHMHRHGVAQPPREKPRPKYLSLLAAFLA